MGTWLDGVRTWFSPIFTGIPTAPTASVDTDTTQLATTEFVNNQLEWGTQPTLVQLADAPVKGGVFNGGFEFAPPFTAVQTAKEWFDGTAAGGSTDKYGWICNIYAGTGSGRFDPIITRFGGYSLKLSTTNITGKISSIVENGYSGINILLASKYLPRVKPSIKYRCSVWAKTYNSAADSTFARFDMFDVDAVAGTNKSTSKLTGTNDWTFLYTDFTSDSDAAYVRPILFAHSVAGNVADAWFDECKIEEIVEDTTFAGTIPTPVRPTIVGVTSTDNIDQSLDIGGAYANTYALTNAVNEGATHLKTFTPTRNKVTQIGVWCVEAGTDVNWTLVVHDASNVVIAAKTIIAADLVEGAFNYFNVPNLWVSGALHFHLYASATTGTPTCKADTSNDLETASYIQYFAKHTENVTIVCNGEKIALDSDSDGMLTGSVIDIDKGKYSYKGSTSYTSSKNNDVYDCSAGTRTDDNSMVKGWVPSFTLTTATMFTSPTTISTQAYITYKVNTLLPVKHLVLYTNFYTNPIDITKYIAVSSDGINWTTIGTDIHPVNGYYQQRVETDVVNGLSTFYIKLYKDTTVSTFAAGIHSIEADLDTSSVPSIILQPLATPVQYSDNIYIPATADCVYLQNAKYANDRGVVVPHLEFCATAVPVKAFPLKVDNTGEANPAVMIMTALSSGSPTIGTGTDDGSGNWILNTGEYIGITGTANTAIKLTYRIGTGTTAFTNLTMNRIYLSSNGMSDSSSKRPSNQFDFYLGMLKEGVQKTIERTQGSVNDLAIAQNSMKDFVTTSVGEVKMSNRYPEKDVILPEGYCASVINLFEIAPRKRLDLMDDTIFEILNG